MAWSNARKARGNGGRSPALVKRPRNCNDVWTTWTASNARSTQAFKARAVARPFLNCSGWIEVTAGLGRTVTGTSNWSWPTWRNTARCGASAAKARCRFMGATIMSVRNTKVSTFTSFSIQLIENGFSRQPKASISIENQQTKSPARGSKICR